MTQEMYGAAYAANLSKTKMFLARNGFSADVCAECSHLAWCIGWEDLEKYNKEKSLTGWINGIAFFKAVDECRRRRKLVSVEQVYKHSDHRSNLHTIVMASKILDAECISRVNAEIFYLHYAEGYNLKEIAQVYGGSESSVSQRLSRTEKKLKKHFKVKAETN